MSFTLAITNQKGGVGKTTTAINLAASLARLQQRVLLVDCDPQGNATMGSGVHKNSLEQSMTEVLLNDVDVKLCLQPSTGGYDVLPANHDLTFAEIELLQHAQKEQRLKLALEKVQENYDFILLDCPPSLNALTLNALVAANHIIIPMQCEYFALEGLTSLLTTFQQIQSRINTDLKILGILCTMFDKRARLAIDVREQLLEHFKELVFSSVIPRNIRLAEAPSHGMATLIYDRTSSGALAYLDLAQEVLCRIANR
jgi:chromosome partitioning protein